MISIGYQLTHDIDWFCVINNIPIHVASNGGRLPNFLTSLDDIFETKKYVTDFLSPVFEYAINERLEIETDSEIEELDTEFKLYFPEAENIFGEDSNMTNTHKAYLWSFVSMAKRGFYSFDKVEMGNKGDKYQLVSYPRALDCKSCYPPINIFCHNGELNFVGKILHHCHIEDPSFNREKMSKLNPIDLVKLLNESNTHG